MQMMISMCQLGSFIEWQQDGNVKDCISGGM